MAVAAAGRRDRHAGLGIDAERIGDVAESLWPLVFTPAERILLAALPDDLIAGTATAMFSAKEALFKCVYPLLERWIDFLDVEISNRSGRLVATTAAEVLNPLLPERVRFTKWISQDHVVILACLDGDATGSLGRVRLG